MCSVIFVIDKSDSSNFIELGEFAFLSKSAFTYIQLPVDNILIFLQDTVLLMSSLSLLTQCIAVCAFHISARCDMGQSFESISNYELYMLFLSREVDERYSRISFGDDV